jgi:hypothetical protein
MGVSSDAAGVFCVGLPHCELPVSCVESVIGGANAACVSLSETSKFCEEGVLDDTLKGFCAAAANGHITTTQEQRTRDVSHRTNTTASCA